MVAIVIEERRRDRDARLVFDPALLRNVRERSIAVVVKQLIRPEIRQQQVDAAVVVDVARRGAEAVLPRIDAALRGDIGEVQHADAIVAQMQVIAKQTSSQRKRPRRRLAAARR